MIVLSCKQVTPIRIIKYLLERTSVKSRLALAWVKAFIHNTNDDIQPLFANLKDKKERLITREKPHMAPAEVSVGKVICSEYTRGGGP